MGHLAPFLPSNAERDADTSTWIATVDDGAVVDGGYASRLSVLDDQMEDAVRTSGREGIEVIRKPVEAPKVNVIAQRFGDPLRRGRAAGGRPVIPSASESGRAFG